MAAKLEKVQNDIDETLQKELKKSISDFEAVEALVDGIKSKK